MAGDLISGEVRALGKRGISEETCRKWNYQVGKFKDRPVQIANYCDEDGVPVAQKIRFPDKDFTLLGDKKQLGLYGQHLWRDGGKMVVVTEGEIDALSVSQLQENKWPVVSVPNGAQGAAKAIAKAIEWLEKFEKVVFLLDDDEPGREAAKECAELLTPGKAFIGRIDGFKDANEALQAHQGKKVIDAIWGAKEFRPDGVIGVADIILKPVSLGVPWPWKSLTDATYGIRTGELYAFGAGVGVGKSDAFKEIAVHLMALGHKVGMLMLEEPPAHTLRTMAGKHKSKLFHIPDAGFTEEEVNAAALELDKKLFLYDSFGANDYDTVKAKITYMVTALGCKYIFLDHLTALAAAVEGDERKAIDKMMADLSALALRLDFALFFVSHLATPEGKPHEEGGRVMEKHFRGSRAIAQWSHFMFGIERDKQKPGQPSTFRTLKDRYTGRAGGLTFGLAYDRESGRVSECELPTEGDAKGFKDETEDDESF
jgi:Replicative DNA helicase